MKILLVSPFLPWPPHDGARIRIFETIRYLSERHEVSLLANVTSAAEFDHVQALSTYCRTIDTKLIHHSQLARLGRMLKGILNGSSLIQSYHYNEMLALQLTELTADEDYDIIQIELSFMSRYVAAISPTSKAKKILSTHNIETQRFRHELKLSAWSARRAVLLAESTLFPNWESIAFRQFDGIVAVSEADASWIVKHAGHTPVELVPNGVDTEYFRSKADSIATSPSIVFTGLMDYPPNSDAVCWFVREIFPGLRQAYPMLDFKIVGARPTDKVRALEDFDGVVVTGEVPDIRPYVHDATAFVVPLRSGGGTRLKILQAMAMSCPVISTAVGAEGLDVCNGDNILFAEDADEFVSQLGKLMKSTEFAARIGSNGRELVVAKYDWKRCLAGEEILYERVLKGRG